MILPNYTTTTLGPTLSKGQQSFLIAMCLSLYAVFLMIQTTRHRSYFAEVRPDVRSRSQQSALRAAEGARPSRVTRP